ncbi:MAG TPA: hypothetical protein QF784_02685, partial [Prochlorococcaceae cyanobacterium Fu_MAG_134]|nr:hypothetical protein [Prochlorococcaceae cyanobacterium Fu_MAG_134]
MPLLIAGLLLLSPEPSQAASGGRIGGGNFRAPSMPRSSSGFRGNYGGGYRGGYRGGGMGFPLIMPFFGGPAAVLAFLALTAVVGILVNGLRGAGVSGASTFNSSSELTQRPTATGPVTIL